MTGNDHELRPRLCHIVRKDTGYGFHLHGEKGKPGQFIRRVEEDSAAEVAGLKAGDRLIEVNGRNVEGESHQTVVSLIKSVAVETRLLVVDRETDDRLRALGLRCVEEFARTGIVASAASAAAAAPTAAVAVEREEGGGGGGAEEEVDGGRGRSTANGKGQNGAQDAARGGGKTPVQDRISDTSSSGGSSIGKVSSPGTPVEPRPRLCHMVKGPGGYGFNLHSEKSKPGQFIRAVDDGSPAQLAGLLPQDRIVEVNGVNIEVKRHSEVVSLIKAGGDETRLLVVDPPADEFFRRCGVSPCPAHIAGPLPQPLPNGTPKSRTNGSLSENNSSEPPSPKQPGDSPPSPYSPPASDGDAKRDPFAEVGLDLRLSVADAKEKFVRKRGGRRAPPMDWSKKKELFSSF
ncbi:LOW QUALITY PROTEIN: Na(+)/H(+) exchange regulatory cofactor NHE-RF2-like [Lampetra fluviatilis]